MPSNLASDLLAVFFIAVFFAVMIWPIFLELQRSKLSMVKIALFLVLLLGSVALISHGLNVWVNPT